MRSSKRPRQLRKREYEAIIAWLKERHPWLDRQVIEIAPGHLALVERLFTQMERLLSPSELRRSGMLCIGCNGDRLMAHYHLSSRYNARASAVLGLLAQAEYSSLQYCPVCGVPVVNGSIHARRCSRHENTRGLFVEELGHCQQKTVKQTTPQAVSDSGKPTTEDANPLTPADGNTPSPAEEAQPAQETAAAETGQGPCVAFLDPAGVKAFVDRQRHKTNEKFRQAQDIADRIKRAGLGQRQLGLLPQAWEAFVDEFEAVFPNFSELANLLRDHFALHTQGDQRVSCPPVLLVGPAGVGKTEATRWLAERLALPFRVVDMASAQSGSTLSGSESFWSNSEPGLLFELLAYQPLANPVIVLDELDKAGGDPRFDPLAALYGLLESRSARNFTDLSIRDFSINASHVNWIATANQLEPSPVPIRSRLTVLHIESPKPQQVRTIAQTIYTRLLSEAAWGNAFTPQLDATVLAKLQALPPRSLGLVLRRALGAAARNGRGVVETCDITLPAESSRRSIGFAGEG